VLVALSKLPADVVGTTRRSTPCSRRAALAVCHLNGQAIATGFERRYGAAPARLDPAGPSGLPAKTAVLVVEASRCC
jgi:hypothetical protein